jgi:DNA-binding NarL/FixJ family response regulator
MGGYFARCDGLDAPPDSGGNALRIHPVPQRDGITTEVRPLSPRELDVARCLARAMTDKQIARELGLTPITIRHHVQTIRGKLKAKNRTAAALWAQRVGLA